MDEFDKTPTRPAFDVGRGLQSHAAAAVYTDPTGVAYSSALFEIRCHQELMKARNMPEFMERIEGFVRRLDFTDFSFSRMHSKGEIEHRMYTTPEPLTQHYRHRHIMEHDLVLQYSMANTKPILKSTIDNYVDSAPFLSETILINRETRKLIESYGFLDYYNLPMKAVNGNGNVMLAITSKNVHMRDFHALVSKHRQALEILARSIDHVGTKKFPKVFLDKTESREVTINPRPLMLLSIMAKENLTLNEAAERLSVSISTANQHIAAARHALDANTTVSALYRAMKEGLID